MDDASVSKDYAVRDNTASPPGAAIGNSSAIDDYTATEGCDDNSDGGGGGGAAADVVEDDSVIIRGPDNLAAHREVDFPIGAPNGDAGVNQVGGIEGSYGTISPKISVCSVQVGECLKLNRHQYVAVRVPTIANNCVDLSGDCSQKLLGLKLMSLGCYTCLNKTKSTTLAGG